jgi:hypothetical protein
MTNKTQMAQMMKQMGSIPGLKGKF